MITTGGAACRINEAPDLRITGRNQHVEKAIDVVGVGGNRVFEAAQHRAERGFVENAVHRTDLFLLGGEVTLSFESKSEKP